MNNDGFTFAGQLCMQDDGQTFSCDLTPHGKNRKIFTLRQPLNAISAITPFNHPLNMVAHKLAPAFATNNCVVLKPTELTPLTALFLAEKGHHVVLCEKGRIGGEQSSRNWGWSRCRMAAPSAG